MKFKKIFGTLVLMTILSSTTVEAATHTTTSALNLRSGPSTSKSKFLVIPKGGQVDSLSVQSNGWHQVKYNNKVGFVSGKYLKQITPAATPTPSAVPASNLSTGSIVTVNSNLNMRTGPSKAYKILLTISKGKEAEYLGTDATGWYQISYNGKTGYISHRFSTVKLSETPIPVPTPVEAAPILEPTPAPVQEPIPVPVEEPVPAVEPAPIPEPVPEPTPLPEPAPVQESAPVLNQLQQVTVYYPTTSLNLRTGAGTNFAVLTSIPKGTHLMVQEISGKWHKVTYRNMTGWISGKYLESGTVWTTQGIIIANKGYGMSSNFAPGENPEARAQLNSFVAAAKASGHQAKMFSGYRSYAYQITLHNRYVANDGRVSAETYSARPGFSEHQTGLVFDVGVGGMTTSRSIGTHPGGIWMAQHAHRFGFVLSYPEGKDTITGYTYEPWHFRFIGIDMATKVYNSGLTLDEYLGTISPNYR